MPVNPENIKAKMRAKQQRPQPTATGDILITHTCGHTSAAKEGDKYLPQKMAKEQARVCPACRQAKQEAEQKAAAERRRSKKPKAHGWPRETGLGCVFTLHYKDIGQWHGAIHHYADQFVISECDTESMRKCMIALNDAYWKWIRSQETQKAQKEAIPS